MGITKKKLITVLIIVVSVIVLLAAAVIALEISTAKDVCETTDLAFYNELMPATKWIPKLKFFPEIIPESATPSFHYYKYFNAYDLSLELSFTDATSCNNLWLPHRSRSTVT